MYDFCLTYPYAAMLCLGGIMGYASKGSLPSLLGGCGSALVLGVLAIQSQGEFKAGRRSLSQILGSLCVSVMLAGVMWLRYSSTGAIMPAALVASISTAMSIFYVSLIVAGGNATKSHRY
eukprot:jgi/Mesvir1/23516/Mv18222-RA.1